MVRLASDQTLYSNQTKAMNHSPHSRTTLLDPTANMASEEIVPFKVDIPKEEFERLKRKLRDTRLPPKEIVPDAGSRYGPTYEWAANLLRVWRDDYDWYPFQAQMNSQPHFHTTLDNVKIHFVHARSPRPDAIPLIMVHGWPGSFYEFSQVWNPLSHPTDASQPAFHVVVPSLPGFAFSDWPPRAGWTLQDTAGLFDKLMKRLGYERYMIQTGDWGHWIGRELGSKYTESCKLVHFNFAPSPLPEGVEYTKREKEPHTIGFGFNDNPMGILTWVGEKYNEAADPEKQKRPYWTDCILTTASLYYFTDCIMPSMLCYYENVRHENFASFAMEEHNRVSVPFGYTSFYWDTEPSSKRAVERTGNLVYYKERNDGGHYAALEDPEGIIEDVRELAAQEWKHS
ncbi:hypothetical protein LTR57_008306 [Friedmanniomyces endolithicus]|nr:hypothetical protein LTR57_008306 [Friedmanniomyces endolithicus]